VLVLTNTGSQPCQVAATTLGTVTLTRVEQDGVPVAPVAILPSFDEDVGELLRQRLQTLDPGASLDLPLQVVPAGDDRHSLLEVSWAPEFTIGALYPFDPAKPLILEARYAVPVLPDAGPPLCAAGSTAAGVTTVQSSWLWWAIAAGGGLMLLVGGLVVVLLLRRRRQRVMAAAAAVLLFAVGVAVLDLRPAPASATIATGDSSLAGPLGDCLDSMRAPGGDPRGILPTLDDPSVRVTVVRDTGGGGNGEYRISPTQIFVIWDPDDTDPYTDGTPRHPCDSLYHELYHAFEDTTPEGVNLHECILVDGTRTGIAVKEVNAVRAENARRTALGRPARTEYGGHTLPGGECRPSMPSDPLCHPRDGCPEPEDGRPADSNGDPHIATFDGLRFDFQAVGEFVVAHDPTATGTDAFQIQARQAPVPGSRTVAVNSAVAADVGGDRVEVNIVDGRLRLVVNGAERENGSVELPNGGEVIYTSRQDGWGERFTVGWPDTSYAVIRPIGRWGLHLYVWLHAGRAGKVTGLFGDADGDRSNDVRVGAGNDVRVGAGEPIGEITFDALYPSYADGLRVSDASSLFTYVDGASTATYTDRSFPDRPETGPGEHRRGWADQICRRLGVTDPVSLDACVIDLINTGSADFAAAARATQSLVSLAGASASSTAVEVTEPGGTSTVEFEATAGQLLYVDVVATTLPDSCGVLRVLGPDGGLLANGCIINGSGHVDTLRLPDTGTYAVVIDPPGDATGTARLRLVFPVDQEEPIEVDGPALTAMVTEPGARARFTFSGVAGQKVYVDATQATLPDQCGVLALQAPSGSVVANGCILNGTGFIDGVELAETGSYAIVVNPAESNTGQVTIRLIEAVDQAGTITVNGPTVVATIGQPGAVSRFTFAGSAGQVVTVEATESTLPDSCGMLSLLGPGQALVAVGCVIGGSGEIAAATLAESGTYTVVVNPPEDATGTIRLRVRT